MENLESGYRLVREEPVALVEHARLREAVDQHYVP
jgi:hypothetical protein